VATLAPAREPPTDLLALTPGRRRPSRPVGLAAGLMAMVFAVGVTVGLSLAPSTSTPATVPAGPGPSRVEQGVPVGYARSPAGAVAAAATFTSVFGDKRLLDPETAREALAVFMAPTLVQAQLVGFPDGGALVDDPGYAQRIQPLGYRVDAFTGDAAQVSVWLVVVGEGVAERTQVRWSTDTLTLEWSDGDWTVTAIDGTEGPTPSAAGDAAPAMNSFLPFTLQPRNTL